MRSVLPLAMLLMIAIGGVGMRIGWWQKEEAKLFQGSADWLKIRLSRPVEFNEYGCKIEWRGWQVYIAQAYCDIGKLRLLSAGDILYLKISPESENIKSKRQLRAEAVRAELIEKPSFGSIFWWQRSLWSYRERIIQVIARVLPGREAGLMAGVLLGVRAELAVDFRQALIKTGTMHVIAASGYNISVVMAMVSRLLLRLVNRRRVAIISLAAVWGYVFMAGADPPIVRAGLMGSLTLFSWIFGREVWLLFGYIICGLLLLVISPWLINSISFQLSMAATAGVIWGTAWLDSVLGGIQRWTKRYPFTELLWSNLMTSVAATGAVLPLLLKHFGEISMLGLIANPMVLGFIPVIMYLGSAMSVAGFIWFPMAQFIGWLVLPLTMGWVLLVMWVSRLPGGMLSFPGNWVWAWGWWIMWLGIILISGRRKGNL